MSKRIIIDPGHGGTDPGASGFGIKEKEWNLRISLYQYKRLKELGANVAITRTTDVTLDPVPRTNLIKGKYDFCISNHWNAFNGQARGIETIHSRHGGGQFATDLAYALVKATKLPLRRVFTKNSDDYPGSDYYFMHRLTKGVITVIIEYGFIDNKTDNEWFKNDTNFYKAAEAVIEVICKHIGITYKSVGSIASKPAPKPVSKSVEQLAQEVIDGKYGSGTERKESLGAKYNDVQKRVNEILAPKPVIKSQPVAKPQPTPIKTGIEKKYAETGSFRADYTIIVRDQPSISGKIVARYYKGETLDKYKAVHIGNGHVWLQYDRMRNGKVIGQGYLPCREYANGVYGELWGTIK